MFDNTVRLASDNWFILIGATAAVIIPAWLAYLLRGWRRRRVRTLRHKVADKFGDMLARSMGALPVGSGLDADVKVGPVINDPARHKMLGLVQEAAGHGARILTGGTAPKRPGYFVPPTVLSNVAPDEHILKEEIFGPIAPIVTIRDVDQAIEYANKTDRGLASYVYTRDLAKGLRVAEAIEAGMVGLNRGFISDPAAPFGGVKQSGVGREGSHEGLLEFLETKYIATNW